MLTLVSSRPFAACVIGRFRHGIWLFCVLRVALWYLLASGKGNEVRSSCCLDATYCPAGSTSSSHPSFSFSSSSNLREEVSRLIIPHNSLPSQGSWYLLQDNTYTSYTITFPRHPTLPLPSESDRRKPPTQQLKPNNNSPNGIRNKLERTSTKETTPTTSTKQTSPTLVQTHPQL